MMRRSLQIDEASYGKDHPAVVRNLNNLAGLLRVTNRLAEVEPLMQRSLRILIALKQQGYLHPNLEAGINNYISFLYAKGLSKEAIQAKIGSLHQQD